VTAPDQGGTQAPDRIALDLWIPEQGLFAALRVGGGAAGFVTAAGATLHAGGSAVELTGDKALLETDTVRLEGELRTGTPPATVSAAGLRRAAELVEVGGTVMRSGKPAALRGRGVLARSWSDADGAARRRFVTAATDDGALLSLVALRADAGAPHGDEVVTGQLADSQSDNGAGAFEDIRLSTIYGPGGLPRTAGAELYRPGDEFPARLSGEAVAGSVLDLGGTGIAICFFRWTLVGRPGWGAYEIEPAP